MHNLASLYASGKGRPRDPVEAYDWVPLAIKNYPADEPHRPGALQLQDDLGAKLSPADLDKARQRIREWKPKSASEASS